MISLKNKLPSDDTLAIIQHAKMIYQFKLANRSEWVIFFIY